MTKSYQIVVTTGKDREVFALAADSAARIRPVRIRVVDGAQYQLSGGDTPPTGAPSTHPALKVRRQGSDLHLFLNDETSPAVVLEAYYEVVAEGRVALTGTDTDGQLHEYLPLSSEAGASLANLSEGADAAELVLSEGPVGAGAAVGALLPAVAAGPGGIAAAIGGLAAAAGGGGGGGGTAASSLTPAQALAAIQAAADANTATSSNLPLSTYTAAGVTGVDSTNLAAINSALDSGIVTSAQLPNLAQVQALVNAYNKVKAAANGTDNDSTALPTAADYSTLGVTGMDDATVVTLLSDVVDSKAFADVDTVSELQALADNAKAVVHYSGQSSGAPTAAQINALVAGFKFGDGSTLSANPVDQVTLSTVLAKIQAANADGTPISSQSELASLVNAAPSYNTAISKLTIFASLEKSGLSAATHPVPTLADYSAVNITVEPAENLNAINDALASAPVTGDWNQFPLQILVDAYKVVLAQANGSAPDVSPLATAAHYTAIGADIGLAKTDADNLALLNDIVGAKTRTGVDTIAEIDALARVANAIEATAAGQTPSTPVTLSDLSAIGLNLRGLGDNNLLALRKTIANKADDGSETNSLAKLQALIDQFDTTPPAAPTAAPSQYKDDVGSIVNNASTAAVTDDTTPGIFVGIGLSDAPSLYVDGTKVDAVYDSARGWLTPSQAVSSHGDEGTQHHFSYTLTDDSGNESLQSPALTLTIDTTAPTLPQPQQYLDDSDPNNKRLWLGGSETTDTTPGLRIGITEWSGMVKHLYVDNMSQPVDATYDPQNGTLTPTVPLGVGPHTLYYKITDAAGNTSALSPGLNLTVKAAAVSPIVLDLNGDGALSYGHAWLDVTGDGVLDHSAWAGPQDGVLVRDANADGRVSGLSEFAFARHSGETDLQGLAALYDSNHDGVFNAQDALFGEFAVWQDANGNGVSDAGELRSLSDLGIVSLSLHSDGVAREPAAGVHEAGRTTVQFQDGQSRIAADAAFDYSAGHTALKLQVQDVLNLPRQVDGQVGDVLQLFGAVEAVNATPVLRDGQAYQAYDLNHDGQLDLLVQQAVTVQWHP